MSTTRRAIFRDEAIRQYIQGRERDILPSYVTPTMFLFIWVVVFFFIIVGLMTWSMRVPVYVSGVGTIVERYQSNEILAVILLSPDQHPKIRRGQLVQLQIGTTDTRLKQTVAFVEPTVMSPSAARQRYGFDNALSLPVTQPSTVVVVTLDRHLVTSLYRGSLVQAEIQVGSQRVFSFLPIVGSLAGSK